MQLGICLSSVCSVHRA